MVDTLSRPSVYHPISLPQTNEEYEYILRSHLYGYVQTSAISLPKFETGFGSCIQGPSKVPLSE